MLNSEGVTTVGCGLIFAMIMPEYPHNARLLKPIERDFAVWRLEMEAGAGEAHEEVSTRQGFVLAFKDPKIWALVLCMVSRSSTCPLGKYNSRYSFTMFRIISSRWTLT